MMHSRTIRRLAQRSSVALLAIALPAALLAQTATLLRPARVFDGSGSAPVSGLVVLVQNGRVTAVGTPAVVNAPSDAVIVDLPGMTLMPGMIDLHSHVLLHPYNETNWNDQVLRESLGLRVARATVHLQRTLRAGFTTLSLRSKAETNQLH